jgi:hypothetical protein
MARCIKCRSAFADEHGLCWYCRSIQGLPKYNAYTDNRSGPPQNYDVSESIAQLEAELERLKRLVSGL